MQSVKLLKEQKPQFLKAIQESRPENRDQLHFYIKEIIGFHVANKQVCPGHRTPFDFLADIFFSAGKPNKIAIAPRDAGGKTRNLSIANSLLLKHDEETETAVIGAILQQANKGYSYLQEYHSGYLAENLLNSKMSLSTYKNKNKCEVLTATVSGVNSPHPDTCFIDEVDLIPWDILQQALSMAKFNIFATTRKHEGVSQGTAQAILEKIETGEMPFFESYIWCIWEVIETCKFNSCEQCQGIVRFTEDGKKESFFDLCQGKARLANGHYKIEDIWVRFTTLDQNVFDTEWLCKRAGRSNRMFPHFEENIHVTPEASYKPNLPVYTGQDFGFTNPAVTLCLQKDSSDNVYIIDELTVREKTEEQLSKNEWQELNNKYNPYVWACDPENPSAIQTMRNNGIKTARAVKVPRMDSIGLIRRLLRPPNSPTPRLFINPKCRNLIWELLNWQKRKDAEDGEKKNDHCIDALRYILWELFGNWYLELHNQKPSNQFKIFAKKDTTKTDYRKRRHGEW